MCVWVGGWWGVGVDVCVMPCEMRCTNQFGRCVHAFLPVGLLPDWSEKTEGVEELGLLGEAKRRETQHL